MNSNKLKITQSRYFENDSILRTLYSDFKKDSRGTFSFVLRHIIIKFRQYFWTIINKINFRYIGVHIGESVIFNGWTILSRYPQSKIVIGKGCSFNSAKNINLIGVNRQCIISTQCRHAFIQIGNYCGLSGATISSFDAITIGNNVKIGANVLITDSDWHPEDPRSNLSKPVLIEDNVWLGINVIVLKGVHIGKNSIIGANSVVTKDIPANVIAAGNPCRLIKQINNESDYFE